jgi:hypothetical protein
MALLLLAVRNQQMVDLGADVCLAFLLRDACRAVDCMTTAQVAGIPVVEYGGPTLPLSGKRGTLLLPPATMATTTR